MFGGHTGDSAKEITFAMHDAEYNVLLDPYHYADYLESALDPSEAKYKRAGRSFHKIKSQETQHNGNSCHTDR